MTKDVSGNLGDAIAGVTILGSLNEVLPPVAAALAILWTLIRIFEWFRLRVLGYPESNGGMK